MLELQLSSKTGINFEEEDEQQLYNHLKEIILDRFELEVHNEPRNIGVLLHALAVSGRYSEKKKVLQAAHELDLSEAKQNDIVRLWFFSKMLGEEITLPSDMKGLSIESLAMLHLGEANGDYLNQLSRKIKSGWIERLEFVQLCPLFFFGSQQSSRSLIELIVSTNIGKLSIPQAVHYLNLSSKFEADPRVQKRIYSRTKLDEILPIFERIVFNEEVSERTLKLFERFVSSQPIKNISSESAENILSFLIKSEVEIDNLTV